MARQPRLLPPLALLLLMLTIADLYQNARFPLFMLLEVAASTQSSTVNSLVFAAELTNGIETKQQTSSDQPQRSLALGQTLEGFDLYRFDQDGNLHAPAALKTLSSENELVHDLRDLKSDTCYPFFLLSKPLEDQVYTLTDDLLYYELEPWTYIPDVCQIEFSFTIEEAGLDGDGEEIDFDEYIFQDWGSGDMEFQADDLVLLSNPARVSKDYIITIRGQIGFMFPLASQQSMKLTVKNPCFDPDYVRIVPVETVQLNDGYTLFQSVRKVKVNAFEVLTSPLENHELCGEVVHKISMNGNELDMRSMPVAFDSTNMNLYMYSESRKDVGMHKLTVEASFANYPKLAFEKNSYDFSIFDNPCAFDQLSFVRPGPLQNVTLFFNQDSVIQDFSVNDFVKRSDGKHDCGGLVVEFTDYDGEPLIENLFNYTQSNFTVKYQPYQAKTRGGYIVKPRVYLADWPRGAVTSSRSVDWVFVKIQDPCIDLDIKERPTLCMTQNHISGLVPSWFRQLTDQYIKLGGNYTYEMGPAVDEFNRPVDVTVTLRRAELFMSFDKAGNKLVIDGSKMTDSTTAYYQVTIEVMYEDIFQILQYYKRHVQFIVTHLAIPKVKAHHKLYFMQEENLPFYFDHEAREMDDQAGGDSRPEPFFVGLTEFGKIKLGWSAPIAPIENLQTLKEKKIARKIESTEIGEEFNDWAWITDRTISNNIAKYELKPAVEIVYQNQKSNKAKDEVKILSATIEKIEERTMDIQAEFENPDSVGQTDKLLVVFWRNEMFSRASNSQNVKFATSIVTPIFRQIDEEEAADLDIIASYLIMLTIFTAMFMVLLAIHKGSLTTFWMFLNSIQLVIYTVLLQTPMPSNASFFMGQVLNLLRLQVFELQPFAQETSSSNLEKLNPTGELAQYYQKMNESEQSAVLILLQSLRFYPSLFRNLAPLFSVFALMTTIWLTLRIVKLVKTCGKREQKCSMDTPRFINCLIRFCYEAFLEVTICCLLSLSLANQAYNFFTALALMWIIVICVGLVLVLFCKGGPYLRKGVQGYQRRTLWSSLFCWQTRNVVIDVERMTEERLLANKLMEQDRLRAKAAAAAKKAQEEEEKKKAGQATLQIQTMQISIELGTQDEIDHDDRVAVDDEESVSLQAAADTERVLLSKALPKNDADEEERTEHCGLISTQSKLNTKLQQQENSLEVVNEEDEVENEANSCVEQEEEIIVLQTPHKSEYQDVERERFEGGEADTKRKRLFLTPGERQRVKQANDLKFRREARRRLMLEDLVVVSQAFQTLFTGLKLGHPENVAVVHPLVFLLRRAFYACGIIFLGRYGVMTLSLMQLMCVFQLCYSIEFKQWRSSLLNAQHLTNELLLYCILLLELCISAHEEMQFKSVLGTVLIWLIVFTFIFNLLICLYSSFSYLCLLQKRRNMRVKPTAIERKLVRQTTHILQRLSTIVKRHGSSKSPLQLPSANSAEQYEQSSSSLCSASSLRSEEGSRNQHCRIVLQRSESIGGGSIGHQGSDISPHKPLLSSGRKREIDECASRIVRGQHVAAFDVTESTKFDKNRDIKTQAQNPGANVKQQSAQISSVMRSRNVAEEVSDKDRLEEAVPCLSGGCPGGAGKESNLGNGKPGSEYNRNQLKNAEPPSDNVNLKTRQRLGSYIVASRRSTLQVINELLKDATPARQPSDKQTSVRRTSEHSLINSSKWDEELKDIEQACLQRIPEESCRDNTILVKGSSNESNFHEASSSLQRPPQMLTNGGKDSNYNMSLLFDSQVAFQFTSSSKVGGENELVQQFQAPEAKCESKVQKGIKALLAHQQKYLDYELAKVAPKTSANAATAAAVLESDLQTQQDQVVEQLLEQFTAQGKETHEPKLSQRDNHTKTPWAHEREHDQAIDHQNQRQKTGSPSQSLDALVADDNLNTKAEELLQPEKAQTAVEKYATADKLSEEQNKLVCNVYKNQSCMLNAGSYENRNNSGQAQGGGRSKIQAKYTSDNRKEEDGASAIPRQAESIIEEDDLDLEYLVSEETMQVVHVQDMEIEEDLTSEAQEEVKNVAWESYLEEISLDKKTAPEQQQSQVSRMYSTGERDTVSPQHFDALIQDSADQIVDMVDEFVHAGAVLKSLDSSSPSTKRKKEQGSSQGQGQLQSTGIFTAEKYAKESKTVFHGQRMGNPHIEQSLHQSQSTKQSRIFGSKPEPIVKNQHLYVKPPKVRLKSKKVSKTKAQSAVRLQSELGVSKNFGEHHPYSTAILELQRQTHFDKRSQSQTLSQKDREMAVDRSRRGKAQSIGASSVDSSSVSSGRAANFKQLKKNAIERDYADKEIIVNNILRQTFYNVKSSDQASSRESRQQSAN